MRVVAFLGFIANLSLSSLAQSDSVDFKTAALQVHVKPSGEIGKNRANQPAFELQSHPGKHFLNYLSSWTVGLVNDTVYANRNIGQGRPQLWAGPIDTVTVLAKDPVEWAKVWIVSKLEVDSHQLSFDKSGYVMPEGIKTWPASHNSSNVSPYLAPFVDANENGIYDPENGDYPSILGDYNAYYISNDLYGENVFETSNKIGIETQGMLYAFDDPILSDIIFIRLYLVNRTARNYAPFYFGSFVDFKLGNADDNIIETDVSRNLLMGLNGDNQDEGVEGFGSDQPAIAWKFLDKNLYASCAFNEEDTVRGIPQTKESMRHIVEGNWANGQPKYANGIGTENSGQVTRFIYPGSSDVQLETPWTDKGSGESIGRRKGLGVVRYPSFEAKSFIQINAAIVTTLSTTNAQEGLLDKADAAQDFFNQTLSIAPSRMEDEPFLYPNPLNISIFNSIQVQAETVVLYNSFGQKIADLLPDAVRPNKFIIPCNVSLHEGVYLLDTKSRVGRQVLKLVVVSDY